MPLQGISTTLGPLTNECLLFRRAAKSSLHQNGPTLIFSTAHIIWKHNRTHLEAPGDVYYSLQLKPVKVVSHVNYDDDDDDVIITSHSPAKDFSNRSISNSLNLSKALSRLNPQTSTNYHRFMTGLKVKAHTDKGDRLERRNVSFDLTISNVS